MTKYRDKKFYIIAYLLIMFVALAIYPIMIVSFFPLIIVWISLIKNLNHHKHRNHAYYQIIIHKKQISHLLPQQQSHLITPGSNHYISYSISIHIANGHAPALTTGNFWYHFFSNIGKITFTIIFPSL